MLKIPFCIYILSYDSIYEHAIGLDVSCLSNSKYKPQYIIKYEFIYFYIL